MTIRQNHNLSNQENRRITNTQISQISLPQPIIEIEDIQQNAYYVSYNIRDLRFDYPQEHKNEFDGEIVSGQKIKTFSGADLIFSQNAHPTQGDDIAVYNLNHLVYTRSSELYRQDYFRIGKHYVSLEYKNPSEITAYITKHKEPYYHSDGTRKNYYYSNGERKNIQRYADMLEKTVKITLEKKQDGGINFKDSKIIGNVNPDIRINLDVVELDNVPQTPNNMRELVVANGHDNTTNTIYLIKVNEEMSLSKGEEKINLSSQTQNLYLFLEDNKVYVLTGAQNQNALNIINRLYFSRDNAKIYLPKSPEEIYPIIQDRETYVVKGHYRLKLSEVLENLVPKTSNPYSINIEGNTSKSSISVELDQNTHLQINIDKNLNQNSLPQSALEYIRYYNSDEEGYRDINAKEEVISNKYSSTSSQRWDQWFNEFGFAVFSTDYKDTVLKIKPHNGWWRFNRTQYNNIEGAEKKKVGDFYGNVKIGNDDDNKNNTKDIIQINEYNVLCTKYYDNGPKIDFSIEIHDEIKNHEGENQNLSYKPIHFNAAFRIGANDLYYDDITFDLDQHYQRKISLQLQNQKNQSYLNHNEKYIDVIETPRGIGIILDDQMLMIEEKSIPNTKRFYNLEDGGRTHSYRDLPAQDVFHRIIVRPYENNQNNNNQNDNLPFITIDGISIDITEQITPIPTITVETNPIE